MEYPRTLVIIIGKINFADNSNNGLLLRNLFGNWPKENIAQIYSSGDNGDDGFFGDYYCLSQNDRRFGRIFQNIKSEIRSNDVLKNQQNRKGVNEKVRLTFSNLFVNTGLHEVIFKIRISKQMRSWISDFKPDIILAQGYNLSFSLLPILVKRELGCKLAFFTTDDWPKYLYNGMLGENKIFSFYARYKAIILSKKLIKISDIPIAFGLPMAKEYEKRYKKKFSIISHSDDPSRYERCISKRLNPPDVFSIIAIGNFNCYRWPLLLDLNEACSKLNLEGIKVQINILSSAIELEGLRKINEAKFIHVQPDPGNDVLPSLLKGADLLFLPEGFDENFVSAINLSISTKAHLFMFSQKPILVYAHQNTGIAIYAKEAGWAKVITERSPIKLMEVIKEQINNKDTAANNGVIAYNFALKAHNNKDMIKQFHQLLSI